MSVTRLSLFLDTNTLLHYPQLKDVDWLKVCKTESATLVLCMQVIQELDDKKSDPRLAGRAERAIKEIQTIRSSGGTVRHGVTLEVFRHEFRTSECPASLSPDSKDDRIVHLVKKYMETRIDAAVAVYTEDYGMALKCEAHSLAVIEPDKASRLETQQSEETKRIRTLEAENRRLTTMIPQLSFWVVSPNENELNDVPKPPTICLSRRIASLDVETAVEQEQRLRQLRPKGNDTLFPGSYRTLQAQLEEAMFSCADIERYDSELEEYLVDFRAYCTELNLFNRERAALRFDFKVVITNRGGRPAENVCAELRFPPCLFFLACGDEVVGEIPKAPPHPNPPDRPIPKIASALGLANADWLNRPPSAMREFPLPALARPFEPDFELDGDETSGYVLRLKVPKLSQHHPVAFEGFSSSFRSWDDASSFPAELKLTADNVPSPIEHSIPFIVSVQD